jgi:hypothetical protein
MAKTETATKTEAPKKAPDTASDEDVAKAVEGAVKGLKGKADRTQVVAALRTAADLLSRDDSWLPGADDAA